VSIKLDWQIEAERIHERASESPEARAQRIRQRRRLILFTMLLIFFIGVSALLILLRLEDVDNQLRQSLIDTLQAELAALRIGNYGDYMLLQRSAGDNWYIVQGERFQHYQQLKIERNSDPERQCLRCDGGRIARSRGLRRGAERRAASRGVVLLAL
jgi:hypothetical protein